MERKREKKRRSKWKKNRGGVPTVGPDESNRKKERKKERKKD